MTEQVDQEIQAISAVLSALTPLSPKARESVLEYVTKRLEISPTTLPAQPITPPATSAHGPAPSDAPLPQVAHIEQLREEKKPRSANEMAALVAYYVSHLAPPGERKETVNTKDIERYFKIAKFRLPKTIRVTLQNAKNAGYLDAAGEGEYKLNPVGYNLVVHSMPRGPTKGAAPSKRGKGKRKSKSSRP